MSYGPGYILWKEILRAREERRLARLQAKRQALEAERAPPAEPSPAAAERRGRRPAGGPAEIPPERKPRSRRRTLS